MKQLLLALPIVIFSFALKAGDTLHSSVSKYSGQQNRTIKSLSLDDIAELKRGGGWGMAKAAELNGIPGPAHLLKMRTEIALTKNQISALTDTYQQMKTEAIKQGEILIAFEGELETHFRNRTITDAILRSSLQAIADVRRELRYIHLATHLKTPNIISQVQISKYNQLRGYTNST